MSGTVTDTTATFTFTSTESGSTFECSLDGAAFAPCTPPRTYSGLTSATHGFRVRAIDAVLNTDPTPASSTWTIGSSTTSTVVRIMAGNITSGTNQSYDPGEGIRIFQGMHPDIALIQEFHYGANTAADIRTFVDTAFGPTFYYFREPVVSAGDLPNGIVSRYPILASGEWHDNFVGNRDYAWARIDVPGPVDLWAVSVHLKASSGSAATRDSEATELVNYINANVPASAYLVIGGDFNTSSRGESCVTTLSQVVITAAPYPADQNGNSNTNAGRANPYDWVIADPDLDPLRDPTAIGASTYPSGLVFDSRVYTPLGEVTPVLVGDSGATGMQHMGVVRDFRIPN